MLSGGEEIRLENLSVSYSQAEGAAELEVLAIDSLSFRRGRITVVMGPSGCGKTTLLNTIAGLISPQAGAINYWTKHFTVGYVFQTPSLLPWRSVRRNALFGAEIAGVADESAHARCDLLLKDLGLGGFEHAYPHELSGGMQQRVSFIRAVVPKPAILLMDEPFAHLDFPVKRLLIKAVASIVLEQNILAILVTHDLEDAVRIADEIVVLTERPARVLERIPVEVDRYKRAVEQSVKLADLAGYVDQLESILMSHQW